MKLEQLPSGSYRIKKVVKGVTYRVTFDHKPTQAEILTELSKRIESTDICKDAFFSCVEAYINSKVNILSPSTIVSYKMLLRNMPSWLNMPISKITQIDIQNAINEYSKGHSPKSVKNYHGLISAVIKMYRPNLVLRTTLPKGKEKEIRVPSHDEITQILKQVEGTEYHIPFQLGCLGMRRGEILALDLSDLDGDCITIDKTMVISINGGYEIKNLPKTVSSVRKIYIPDKLAEEIREKGYIYKGSPGQMLKALHRTQDRLGIPRSRFHDLRHYFVSYAHSLGWADADIIAITGHKTDEIAKRVYRHSMADRDDKKNLANMILD